MLETNVMSDADKAGPEAGTPVTSAQWETLTMLRINAFRAEKMAGLFEPRECQIRELESDGI